MTGRRGPIGVKVSGDGDDTWGSCHTTGQAATAPRGTCQEKRHSGFASSSLPPLSPKFLSSSSGSSPHMLLAGFGAKPAVHMPGAAHPLQLSLVRCFVSVCCWSNIMGPKHKGDWCLLIAGDKLPSQFCAHSLLQPYSAKQTPKQLFFPALYAAVNALTSFPPHGVDHPHPPPHANLCCPILHFKGTKGSLGQAGPAGEQGMRGPQVSELTAK